MSLQDIEFQREYRSMHIDICKQFYVPALKEAVSYKRSVGFFSSSALVEISLGLNQLVSNEGKVQIIASPRLSEEDVQAINNGYEKRDEIIEKCLLRELDKVVELKPYETKSLAYLTQLIALDILDIKIAILSTKDGTGIYHEKLGLISDSYGNTVAFTGSMNETATGMKTNYETVDVYTSWSEDRERVQDKIIAFETLWNNLENNVEVLEYPKIKEAIVKKYKQEHPIPVTYMMRNELDDYLAERSAEYDTECIRIPEELELREYQKEAIDKWEENGYRGIFDMATGTGKTYTGLAAVARLANQLNGRLAIIIVVPYQHLVEQWVEDIIAFGMRPLAGYSGSKNKNYKKQLCEKVWDYNLNIIKSFCFICTNATFVTKTVQEELERLEDDVVLLVDEAHNAGTKGMQVCLTETYKYRLALSATIDRHHDEEGTEALYHFFGKKCIEYSLKRAIEKGKLTRYYYYPIVVSLTEEELRIYNELTDEIGKNIIKTKGGKIKLNKYGEMLAIKRSRLIAGAVNKVDKLVGQMQEHVNDTNMLVYCGAANVIDDTDIDDEEIRQIDLITQKLGNDLNMRVAKYTSNENSTEREKRKKQLVDEDVQALIAIKCLDEGVNIPSVRTAFILASSTNEKEYIQRRGRVLRKAPGKKFAIIYDFVTLPRELYEMPEITPEEMQREKRLIINELKRILEFKNLSENPYDSEDLIDELVAAYNLFQDKELNLYGGIEDGEGCSID